MDILEFIYEGVDESSIKTVTMAESNYAGSQK